MSAQIEAAKAFRYHDFLPQKDLVRKLLDKQMSGGINNTNHQITDYDRWKTYEFDPNYVKKHVKISQWINLHIAQNVYDVFYVCPEWICAQMNFQLGKPQSSKYLNAQCESHKNGTCDKACTELPMYMYTLEECNSWNYDNQSFVTEYVEPLKKQVCHVSYIAILAH